MRVQFTKRENGPERLAAEAELCFDGTGSVLDGTKLAGFSVWASPDGEFYVTVPARGFGAGRDRRYFDFLRVQESGNEAMKRVKSWILDAFKEWNQ